MGWQILTGYSFISFPWKPCMCTMQLLLILLSRLQTLHAGPFTQAPSHRPLHAYWKCFLSAWNVKVFQCFPWALSKLAWFSTAHEAIFSEGKKIILYNVQFVHKKKHLPTFFVTGYRDTRHTSTLHCPFVGLDVFSVAMETRSWGGHDCFLNLVPLLSCLFCICRDCHWSDCTHGSDKTVYNGKEFV